MSSASPSTQSRATSITSVLDVAHFDAQVTSTTPAWRIHGQVYDLSAFLERHPGGPEVLRSVKGTEDLTAIFESSHAFADRARVEGIMSKYRVGTCEPSPLAFPANGFYRVVTERVRAKLFAAHGVHATGWWWLKSALLTLAWAASFAFAFFGAGSANASTGARCLASLIAGHLFICVGFVVMHDASHSAVSSSPRVNGMLSWLWNATACWDHRLWHKHHVYRHHSFTGDVSKDPDTVHFTPFLKKHAGKAGGPTPIALSRCAPWSAAVFFVGLFPGMYLGQVISYARWWQRGRLWKMSLVPNTSLDVGACAIRGAVLYVFMCSPLVALCYLLANNFTYAVCILPDHDTEDTRLASAVPSKDWGEEQVRNSANFATANPLVGALYGGINFQIEHHLFPTLSHVHYATVQPIVRQACAEWGIPYVEHPSICAAYGSALRAIAKATLEVSGID